MVLVLKTFSYSLFSLVVDTENIEKIGTQNLELDTMKLEMDTRNLEPLHIGNTLQH